MTGKFCQKPREGREFEKGQREPPGTLKQKQVFFSMDWRRPVVGSLL